MNPKLEKILINGIKGYYFYDYNDKIQSLLYQFKGCYDLPLAPIFFSYQKILIKVYFHGYIFVPVPSYENSDEERGFNHVEEMLKSHNFTYISALKKVKDVKQANLDKASREKNSDVFALTEKAKYLANKKVCLIDDVITTGSTIHSCLNLLKSLPTKKLKFLAMSHTLLKQKEN